MLSDALICVLRPFTIFSRRNYFDVFVILKFKNHDTLKSIAIKLFIKSIRGTVPTFVGIGCAYWVPRSFFRAQIILKCSEFTWIHYNSLHVKKLIYQHSLQFTHIDVVNSLYTFFLIFLDNKKATDKINRFSSSKNKIICSFPTPLSDNFFSFSTWFFIFVSIY